MDGMTYAIVERCRDGTPAVSIGGTFMFTKDALEDEARVRNWREWAARGEDLWQTLLVARDEMIDRGLIDG